MSEHTPGPWECEFASTGYRAPDTYDFQIVAENMVCPAIVWGGYGDGAANARLIAAAPDLLASCKEFVRKVECGEARSTRSYAQMKAAIAKAEGC